ncbi:hypothetical protein J1N35_014025 [Gossypium stocksii]|uniref:Zinc finger, CCHC-type n=1 Tax=Gossypium stocksii TaxID=47602 RepID=A0A9D3VV71_9ROSI|nr:hypothetical protein J1N35_014025 [Gossypium stocksii]
MLSLEVLGTNGSCPPSLVDLGGMVRDLGGAIGVENDRGSKHIRRRSGEDDTGDDVSGKEHQGGQYNRVSLCNNAKEIWDKLKVTHKGKSRVKESKIILLTLDYELFKAKLKERIKEMSDLFTNIINGLKALGKIYLNKEIVK